MRVQDRGAAEERHYVAAATRTYRAALDHALANRAFAISPEQKQDLAQSFSRGFTHGFLDGPDHQSLVHARFPKLRGIRVGTVVGKTPAGIVIQVEPDPAIANALKAGDGIVFDEGHPEQDEQGGRVFAVAQAGGNRVEITLMRGDVQLAAIPVGAIVWKTDDPAVRRRLEQTWSRAEVTHRIPLHVSVCARIGQSLRVKARDDDGHEASAEWAGPLQAAHKHPISVELLNEQFSRLGNTPFALGSVGLEPNPAEAMAPKSVLNDLRRRVVDELLRQRGESQVHRIANPSVLAELRREALRICSGDRNVPTRTCDGRQECLPHRP